MKTIAAAAFAICFATSAFAQTPTQPPTSTTPTAQPSMPTTQPVTPATQPVTPTTQPVMPATQGTPTRTVMTGQPATGGQQPGATATGAMPATGAASLANTEVGTAALLVDRALSVLDKASNSKTGDVTLDRGLLDEVRAELSQVKATLQAAKQ